MFIAFKTIPYVESTTVDTFIWILITVQADIIYMKPKIRSRPCFHFVKGLGLLQIVFGELYDKILSHNNIERRVIN